MNKRRDALKAMMAPIAVAPSSEQDRPMRSPVASGSLKAMGLSLKSLADEAEEARALRQQLASGAQVTELDPNLIDPSFVRDRLEDLNDKGFEDFKASLAEDGQQVPILVRPHPDREGRYQAAYGHRRVAALRALGLPAKAVVRELTNEELIVAQGKENSDRRDLSFIERALFAARLEDLGFARTAITAALSLQKGNLSTMISVAKSIPEELIVAVGPAPKIGRPRWEGFAELVKQGDDKWRLLIREPSFSECDSDARFEHVFKALQRRPAKTSDQVVKTTDGQQVARVEQAKDRLRLTIENRHTPNFGAYLVEHLPEIYAAFLRRTDA